MLLALLRRYLRPHLPMLAVLLAFQILQILGTLLLPNINGRIVDEGVAAGDTGTVARLGGLMLGIAFGQVIANVIAIIAGAFVSMAAARDVRADFFAAVQGFGRAETARFGASTLVTRSTNDIRQVQQFLTMALSIMIMAPIMALGGLALALAQDLALSWVILATVAVLVAVMAVLVMRMVPSFRVMQDRIDAISSVLAQQLAGLRVIRAFTKEDEERARFARANTELTDAQLRVGTYFVALFPAVMTLVNAGTVAVVWFGAQQIQAGASQIGTVMAFIQYLMLILMGVVMFAFMSMMVPRAQVAAGRVLEVIDTRPEMDRGHGTVERLPSPGTIAFDGVAFRYPGARRCVVEDVTFAVPAGATCAVIGSTGAGKSTLVQLLVRLLEPTAGRVSVGGADLAALAPEVLAGQFGYVPQRAYVFGGTVRANLALGNPTASDALMWSALETAQAAEFVRAYADGLDHVINEGGTDLSGGQRQRLAIAMAVCREAPILIFDDSFSALDTATDRAVRSALAADTAATTFIVTQRVASAMAADLIVVFEAGRVVAQGTHAHLLEDSPIYRDIVSSQVGPPADPSGAQGGLADAAQARLGGADGTAPGPAAGSPAAGGPTPKGPAVGEAGA